MPSVKRSKSKGRSKPKAYSGPKSGLAAVRKTRSEGGRGTRPRGTDTNLYQKIVFGVRR